MRTIVAIVLIITLAGCSGSNDVKTRAAYWQSMLTQDVPVGSEKKTVIAWANRNKIKFEYIEEKMWLYSNVEKVKASGIPFPCSEWNIIITVMLNKDGQVLKNDVSTVGSCI